MTFIHDDPEFRDLVQMVAADGPLASAAMVEKDYWICHSLWAIERSGIEFWFKGGTSLSKGFSLLPRFSEDLDLVVLPGRLVLPEVSSWRTETAGATSSRRQFWQALLERLAIPGADLGWDEEHDPTQRNVGFHVLYPGHLGEAHAAIRPYVLLEMSHGSIASSARAPSVERTITSAVHDWLDSHQQLGGYTDNRPIRVHCVHPYVTLLEKLDAITRRYERDDADFDPAAIARHYEDAARIIQHEMILPPLEYSVPELAGQMLRQRQIRRLVTPEDPAFRVEAPERRTRLLRSYRALDPMYWEARIPLEETLEDIAGWVRRQRFDRMIG